MKCCEYNTWDHTLLLVRTVTDEIKKVLLGRHLHDVLKLVHIQDLWTY
jgi:hypothetical protein